MKVLVDTCVWSLALRKSNFDKDNPNVKGLIELIGQGRTQIFGPIRQEILSGIKSKSQYIKLRNYLAWFPDIPVITHDFIKAAEYYNLCRKKGVQGSNTDFLICAISTRLEIGIFTTDNDFAHFQDILPIKLHFPT